MKKKNRTIVFFTIVVFITTILLTIGYSAFSDQLTITKPVAYIRADIKVRITGVISNNSSVTDLNYTENSISSKVSIPAGSSVTYSVTAKNFWNVLMAISNITPKIGNNTISDLKPSIDETNYEIICNEGETHNEDTCTKNIYKTFNLTLTNTGNTTITTNTDEYLDLAFTFTEFHTVTYNDEEIGTVLTGHTFTYTFTSNAPSTITVVSGTCNTPSIDNNILTIPNVTSDLVLTGTTSSGGGEGTQSNPYINTSETYDISNVQDGYTRFDEAPGQPLITATTETVNGQEVTTITSFKFTDTGTDGIVFGTNDNPALDTGVLAIDGKTFSIHIRFKTNLYNNQGKMVLSALQEISTNTYSGFTINIDDSSTSYLKISSYINKTYSGTILYPTQSQSINSRTDANSHTENEYELTITYNPNGGGQPLQAVFNGSTVKIKKNSMPTSLTDAKITIGGNGLNNTDDMNSLKIIELEICKGTFDANYKCTLS